MCTSRADDAVGLIGQILIGDATEERFMETLGIPDQDLANQTYGIICPVLIVVYGHDLMAVLYEFPGHMAPKAPQAND